MATPATDKERGGKEIQLLLNNKKKPALYTKLVGCKNYARYIILH
jgi:hypothetical protein